MTGFSDMDHENLIVIHFNQYAGGKFFINCLSHQLGVLPGLGVASTAGHIHHQWILSSQLTPQEKENKKIARIVDTLVPRSCSQHEWAGSECGCVYFWGAMFHEFIRQDTPKAPSQESINLLQDNICFLVNHDVTEHMFHRCQRRWPKARHIALHNSQGFQQISVSLKTMIPTALTHNELPMDFPDIFYVDVDNTYHSVSKIKQKVIDCLEWLEVPNIKLHSNLDSYISRYVEFHYQQ